MFFVLLAPVQELDATRTDNPAGMTVVGLAALLFLFWLWRRVRGGMLLPTAVVLYYAGRLVQWQIGVEPARKQGGVGMNRTQKGLEVKIDDITFPIVTEPIPLETDADGVVRVGGTRVTLDTVVAAFKEGATAEEIVYQYPSLDLVDVYLVIGYYLQRRTDVEAYLHWRQRQADEARERNEARFDPHGIRDRLLARRAGQKAVSYAAAGC